MARPAGVPEGAVHQGFLDGMSGFFAGGADGYALARGEALGLDHDGHAEFTDEFEGLGRIGEGVGVGGWHAGGDHDILGEDLAPFHLGGGLGGAEYAQAFLFKGVGEPGAERGLGPDHGEVGPVFLGPGDEGRNILRTDREIHGKLGGSGITGRAKDLRTTAVVDQFPGQGMLPAATTYD